MLLQIRHFILRVHKKVIFQWYNVIFLTHVQLVISWYPVAIHKFSFLVYKFYRTKKKITQNPTILFLLFRRRVENTSDSSPIPNTNKSSFSTKVIFHSLISLERRQKFDNCENCISTTEIDWNPSKNPSV